MKLIPCHRPARTGSRYTGCQEPPALSFTLLQIVLHCSPPDGPARPGPGKRGREAQRAGWAGLLLLGVGGGQCGRCAGQRPRLSAGPAVSQQHDSFPDRLGFSTGTGRRPPRWPQPVYTGPPVAPRVWQHFGCLQTRAVAVCTARCFNVAPRRSRSCDWGWEGVPGGFLSRQRFSFGKPVQPRCQ